MNSLEHDILESLDKQVMNNLLEIEEAVLQDRLFILDGRKRTLASIGEEFNVTRERARQREDALKAKIKDAFHKGIPEYPVLDICNFEEVALDIESKALWHYDARNWLTYKVYVLFLLELKGMFKSGELLISIRIKDLLSALRDGIEKAEYKAVDKGVLLELIPEDLHGYFDTICKLAGISKFYDMYAVRWTYLNKLITGFKYLNRPISKSELGEMTDVPARSLLNYMATHKLFHQVNKVDWVLAEWGYPRYDGIAYEIKKRIIADGGSSSYRDLLDELPGRLKVSRNSVQWYTSTPAFIRKEGQVSICKPEDMELKPLNEVVDGIDYRGYPYWTFKVKANMFRGYSLTLVPFEITKLMGCELDSSCEVKISNMPECRTLTVQAYIWQTSKGNVGYIKEPVEKLGLKVGDTVRMTIIDKGVVELVDHYNPEGYVKSDIDTRSCIDCGCSIAGRGNKSIRCQKCQDIQNSHNQSRWKPSSERPWEEIRSIL